MSKDIIILGQPQDRGDNMEMKEVILHSGGTSGQRLDPWTYKELNVVNNKVATSDGIELTEYINQYFQKDGLYNSSNFASGIYEGTQTEKFDTATYYDPDNTAAAITVNLTTRYIKLKFIPEVLMIHGRNTNSVAILYPKLGYGYYYECINSNGTQVFTQKKTTYYSVLLNVGVSDDGVYWSRLNKYVPADSTDKGDARIRDQLLNTYGVTYEYTAFG